MITVSGEVTLKLRYNVAIDMSVENFDKMSEGDQNALIENTINWSNELRNVVTDEIEVWDVEEL